MSSSSLAEEIVLDAGMLHADGPALQREWLVANGIGGYASATVAGANTRRYHGLLVAALHPPLGRAVLLSKLEETIEVRSDASRQTYELSTNVYPDALYPQGHRMLESWQARPVPTWVWSPLPGLRLEKRIWMAHEYNTTYIAYRLLEAPAGSSVRLSFVPLLAWKDYHSEMLACDTVLDAQWRSTQPACLRLTLPPISNATNEPTTLVLRVVDQNGRPLVDTTFAAKPDWYYRFQHPREQERGLNHTEDLYAPGTLSLSLPVGSAAVVVAGAEPLATGSPLSYLKSVADRQEQLIAGLGVVDPFAHQLALASDPFVIQVPNGRSTVIAGYHWFSDWGRDTMIALPGLCLYTGRADVAREILRSFAGWVSDGMLPNRFPDVGETPEYNTVDATLWYFVAIYRYIEATNDLILLRDELWPILEQIIRWHRQGTRYNIHVDAADDLLYAGQPGVQLTWMDAKVGDWVVTPRIGKPVEINALWYNALRTMAYFAERLGYTDADGAYAEMASKTANSFTARFARPDGFGLYDVLDTPDGNLPDGSMRPNQIFALSLPFAPVEPTDPLAPSILKTVQDELYTPVGLRTLSPRDPAYRPRYEGDPLQRDGAYHQGTAWPWLMGPFAEAHYKVMGDRQAARALLRPLREQLTTYGMGSLAEVFDGSEPQRPAGCIAQAWSVAETLRVWKLLIE